MKRSSYSPHHIVYFRQFRDRFKEERDVESRRISWKEEGDERTRKGGLTDKIAWEYGRRVEIRVPCSSVCLGSLNKCKSTAVISRRGFSGGRPKCYASFDFTYRRRVFLRTARRSTFSLPASFKQELPAIKTMPTPLSLLERIHSSQQFDIIFFFLYN